MPIFDEKKKCRKQSLKYIKNILKIESIFFENQQVYNVYYFNHHYNNNSNFLFVTKKKKHAQIKT